MIAGERRLKAAHAAGLEAVPVHVVAFDDQQVFEAALVENIQRADLNAIEKAAGFKEYVERFGLTQEQLGAKIGVDRTTISNLLGLLNLPGEVQDAVPARADQPRPCEGAEGGAGGRPADRALQRDGHGSRTRCAPSNSW